MTEFNPELIRALANGDAQALEQIKSYPLTVRMALGTAVDQLRRDENIVPMSGGGFSLYEQKPSSYMDTEAVGKALAERNKKLREAEELKEKIREEHLLKVAKQQATRARLGLRYDR
ncbi:MULTISPECIES: hypothetical protein [Sporolactobacillus]|uniref:Uncharacterized protein n=2 Tax=Sporolactobacillus TaxID=2077 RepID=A0A0U1QLE0_9BACL|nr:MULTISPECIES: hypothetical protein [Sporolactobacillus]KLI01640.1 hypothetical protein SINU_12155 [Sporolactobacillus inulinus CASD]MBM7657828.1 hypothetical protein [Sporolactobacillus spathodeae]GEB76175.1 hypothetical protein SIN01_05200 [Sporolactobacillus inulinus]